MRSYLVIYEWAEGNWSAYAPDVPGCVSTGLTREECESSFAEALELHFEGLREDGLPIPEPLTQSGRVTVAA